MIDPEIFADIEKPEGRKAVVQIHAIIRDLILSGKIAPETILTQVELSRIFGVSRTPVREALRRLQESGLVSAEPNFRCRVFGFEPDEAQALYVKRILIESYAVALTVSHISDGELAALADVVEELEREESRSSFARWQELHREFHRLITCCAVDPLASDLAELERQSERYQSAYKGELMVGWWQRSEKEHREIFEAISDGDQTLAAKLCARHLARTALALLAVLAPEYDAFPLRMSLNYAIGAAESTKGTARRRGRPR